MKRILLCVVCAVTLMSAVPAFAAGPTQGAYSGPGSTQLSQAQPTGTAATHNQTVGSGTLPFTGLSLPLIALVAAGLVGSGLVLKTRTGSSER